MEAIMSERTSEKPGIADYVVARRKRKESFLDEIDRLIDWQPLEKVLRNKLKRVANAVGNPAYPPLLMVLGFRFSVSNCSISQFIIHPFLYLHFFLP